MSNDSPTFRLFKRVPSFKNGISSALDLFGSEGSNYRMNTTEKEADMDSIYSDWLAVGNDMRKAIKDHGAETAKRK